MISDIETLFRSAWVRLCTLLMVVAVAVLGLAAAAPVAHAAEVGDPAATKGKTYKIGTDTTFAPFEYQEKGKMVGIDMELIQSIAKKEGFKIEIQASGFNAALQALSSNQVDLVIAGMSIRDERKPPRANTRRSSRSISVPRVPRRRSRPFPAWSPTTMPPQPPKPRSGSWDWPSSRCPR